MLADFSGENGKGVPTWMAVAWPSSVYLSEKDLYEVNKTVLARVFWDDPAFITSTTLNGKLSLRLCIMNHSTTWNDVWETLESIEKFGVDALAVHDKQADTAWATKPPCSCVGCESRDVRGVNA